MSFRIRLKLGYCLNIMVWDMPRASKIWFCQSNQFLSNIVTKHHSHGRMDFPIGTNCTKLHFKNIQHMYLYSEYKFKDLWHKLEQWPQFPNEHWYSSILKCLSVKKPLLEFSRANVSALTGFPVSQHASEPLSTSVQNHTLTVTTHDNNKVNRSANTQRK